MTAEKSYVRFTLSERLEHLTMLLTFVTLAVTGLPQKFADTTWADALLRLLGGIESARSIHHIAAIILMLEAVYHLAAVGYRVLVLRHRLGMLPTLGDLGDGLQMLRYNLGLAHERPQLPRFSFEEKIEYWSLVWGTAVMVLTGFMMWNPVTTSRLLSGEVIPAAKAAHGSEALLAVLAIVIWHMWAVHLRHFNLSMWTGRLSEREMIHEHALELADIKAGVAEPAADAQALRARRARYLPAAGVLTAGLFVGIYYFFTFEKTAITTVPPADNLPVYAPQTPTPLPTLPPTPTPAPVTPVPTAAGGNTGGAVTWDGAIGAIFQSKCAGCHNAGGSMPPMGGLSLASYADALKGATSGPVIVPGNAEGSKLVEVQSAGTHPGKLSDEELAQVKTWIANGAPEK